MHIGDDGAIVFQESVEQGGFANVGLADNGDGDALLEGLSCLETTGKTGDVIVNSFGEFKKFARAR